MIPEDYLGFHSSIRRNELCSMIAFSLTPPLINIKMVAAYDLLASRHGSFKQCRPRYGSQAEWVWGTPLLEASTPYHPGPADG